jgi:integrase
MTFDRLWLLYLENKPGLKGRASDQSRYRRYIQPTFGNKEPHELVALDIDRLRLGLSKKYSPQTVKHVLVLIRRLVRFGSVRGLCQPFAFPVEVPSVHNETTEDLSTEQLARLLKAIDQDKHPHAGPMLKLALFLGLRKGELLDLQWQHVDLVKGFLRLANPKGGRPVLVPINSAARGVIEGLPRTERSDYLFPGKNGARRREIRRPIERIRRAAQLPAGFRPLHGLRHHFASALASSGEVTMAVLQRLMTHRSSSTTQRYAHLREIALRQASELAGQLISEAGRDEEAEPINQAVDK